MPRPQPDTITDGPASCTLPNWKMEGFWQYVMWGSPRRPATAGRYLVSGVRGEVDRNPASCPCHWVTKRGEDDELPSSASLDPLTTPASRVAGAATQRT